MEKQNLDTAEGKVQGSESQKVNLKVSEAPFQVNEAINTLRGNIQLSGFDIKLISITSSLKHEGKSSISFLLAKSFAGLEKNTLYLDCDIRNSHIISRYNVRQKVRGLTEYLVGEASLSDVIYQTNEPNLDVIFTGAVAPNPSELFSSQLFHDMLRSLRDTYEYVIVDTPPINAVIDGVLISKECDGTVLVVESGFTDRLQVTRARQQLEFAGVKMLGVVLNKIGSRRSGYGYGYGYGYGHYGYGHYGYGYGYGEDRTANAKKKKKKKK